MPKDKSAPFLAAIIGILTMYFPEHERHSAVVRLVCGGLAGLQRRYGAATARLLRFHVGPADKLNNSGR